MLEALVRCAGVGVVVSAAHERCEYDKACRETQSWILQRVRDNFERRMPISGLVLTLEPGDGTAVRVSSALGADPRLTLGGALGCKLPVVAETQAPDEAEALVNELFATPGVCFVDVVFVDISLDCQS